MRPKERWPVVGVGLRDEGGVGSICMPRISPAREEGAPRLIIVRMLAADRLATVLQRPEVGVVLLGHELRTEGWVRVS